ncbi:MAG: hypothetical protein CMK07_13315 [Ponticaulis sp.]|nr:hypothetical protein [Ponticaulis sp.]
MRFLKTTAVKLIESDIRGVAQRPLIRQQVYGETVTAVRLNALHKLDERLHRQYDQTPRTLERVQKPARKRTK